ncbi:putative aldo keto reductase [Diaporthe ampelina]|uniref:Putative aldo keto reductase n=1 Tax=Diaporthe ampelina TaxID=1214573 RepID=A0A0G2FT12_9PEZI|nr:putative aldo keto reductase [Diaporthe ampelina]
MAAPSQSAQKIVFGAMTIGQKEVDTARIYGGGSSEAYLAQLGWQSRGLSLATKLPPAGIHMPPFLDTRNKTLRDLVLESMSALKTEKVDLLYLHGPDRSTPYEQTLREMNDLYNEGYFARFGISNFAAWEVAQMGETIHRNGWKKIDVYQGVYNALHRAVEPELLPALKHYGIAFYAYNPLAGGFLTDRYERETEAHEGRFDPKRAQGAMYRGKYWNDAYFDALDIIRPRAKSLGLTTAQAALRWVNHHSGLTRESGDAIITSASSAEQLEENLIAFEMGPLPDELVQAFEEGYRAVKANVSPYFF